MKKLITVLLASLSITTFAQKGMYLKPTIGAGISRINNKLTNASAEMGHIFCFGLGVDAGYQIKHLRLQTGLRFMQTGEKNKVDIISHPKSYMVLLTPTTTKWKLGHIVVPVIAAYQLGITKKISLVPAAGLLMAYHVGETRRIKTNVDQTSRTNLFISADKLNRPRTFGMFATGEVGVQYNIVKKFSLHVTPAFNYMFTNMAHTNVIGPANTPFGIRPYSIMLNAGIVMDI